MRRPSDRPGRVPKNQTRQRNQELPGSKTSALERKRLLEQEKEQQKLDAIEEKIRRARERMEAKTKHKSHVARETRIKLNPKPPRQEQAKDNRRMRHHNMSQNDDLDFVMEPEDESHYHGSSQRAMGQKRNGADENRNSGNRRTLMNAGLNASKRGLYDDRKSDDRSETYMNSNREVSPAKNLDLEGSSQMTYPNRMAQQFMPKE